MDEIKNRIVSFIGRDKAPQFWAYFAAHDWVVFCWLFGSMMDLPRHYPMFCRDIMQLAETKGNPKLSDQTHGSHNALEDAKHTKLMYEHLSKLR